MTSPTKDISGHVYLVGAGPGDPSLITLRGYNCIQIADVVLYDALVNPRILDFCGPQAELISLGRHGRGAIVPQNEINRMMIAHAQAGKKVVRLKGGDPSIFARIGEETDALEKAEISYSIVPGITASLAAGSYAGIPLTHREHSSAVALITGHEATDKVTPPIDYRQLAHFPGTLVFYMGVTTARTWSMQLIEGGMAPETPVALVRRCSWPNQMVRRCALADVADVLDQRKQQDKIRPPVIAIVGQVANEELPGGLPLDKPLQNARVLVTRPREVADEFCFQLELMGADVLVQSTIEITPVEDFTEIDDALARLNEFDWLVFSSSNGVRHLLDRLLGLGRDMRALASVRLAVVGPGTANTLQQYHLKADLQPEEYRGEALAEALVAAKGERYLLARASRGRDVMGNRLTEAGGHVEEVVVYQSRDVEQPHEEVTRRLEAGEIDWVTVTSSAIARSLVAMFGEWLRNTKLASISPITSDTLRELGFEPAVEAAEHSMQGLADAIGRKHATGE